MENHRIKKSLLLLNLGLSSISIGQIWLVQLSAYPLWAYVVAKEFHTYHLFWWHSIWMLIFIPAGAAIVTTIAMFWLRPPEILRSLIWIACTILFVTYSLTYFWWAPLMVLIGASPEEVNGILQGAPYVSNLGWNNETQQQLYNLLINSHWLMVALITAYGILIFYMSVLGLNVKKNISR
ncbi:MAG: hypothetical protein ABI359_00675 [Ginsengibacter sp.]